MSGKLTSGAYIGVPEDDRFRDLAGSSRSLNALYLEIPHVAAGRLLIVTPYLDARAVDFLVGQWIAARPDLAIDVVHRKEAGSAEELAQLRSTLKSLHDRSAGRVNFYTFPQRDPKSNRLVDRTSFHCKLVDPGNGQIVELSSNLTTYAQQQNIEVAYVHPTGRAQDLLALARRLRQHAALDPWQE